MYMQAMVRLKVRFKVKVKRPEAFHDENLFSINSL